MFSTSQHGFSLNSMYRKMNRLESPILVVIEDTEHNVSTSQCLWYIFSLLLWMPTPERTPNSYCICACSWYNFVMVTEFFHYQSFHIVRVFG